MTRKDFLKNMATVGVASPFLATLFASCDQKVDFYENVNYNFDGKILIIGAGSAGLIAGHILSQNNIDFQILEASSVFGGRVKRIEGFADFPIDLGGEWIHTDPSILGKLLNDPSTDADIEVVSYSPETISTWKDGKLKKRNIFSHFYGEYKFKNTTWYGFFEKYIVPGFSEKIIYNSPVKEIDYTGNNVVVTTNNGEIYEADKVLVTVPVNILKSDLIEFSPALPSEKINALDQIDMPEGIKVFMEFSERFYPDLIIEDGLFGDMEKLFYDAAFRKDSERNIYALFSVGYNTSFYTNMTEEEIIKQLLSELDEIFDGKASQTYIKHVIQNWSKEPYIQGSYSHYGSNSGSIIETMTQPLDNKVYFAGEAFNINGDTATVHGAGESSYQMVEVMLKG